MIWEYVKSFDGDCDWHCVRVEVGPIHIGDLCVEDGDEKGWRLAWFNGGDTDIGCYASEAEARKAGEAWLHALETWIGNRRVRGVEQPDDGE